MAEWLCSGLQIRVRRFNSGPGLQPLRGLAGRDNRFQGRAKWQWLLIRSSSAVEQPAVNRLVGGSNPSSGANKIKGLSLTVQPLDLFGATSGATSDTIGKAVSARPNRQSRCGWRRLSGLRSASRRLPAHPIPTPAHHPPTSPPMKPITPDRSRAVSEALDGLPGH